MAILFYENFGDPGLHQWDKTENVGNMTVSGGVLTLDRLNVSNNRTDDQLGLMSKNPIPIGAGTILAMRVKTNSQVFGALECHWQYGPDPVTAKDIASGVGHQGATMLWNKGKFGLTESGAGTVQDYKWLPQNEVIPSDKWYWLISTFIPNGSDLNLHASAFGQGTNFFESMGYNDRNMVATEAHIRIALSQPGNCNVSIDTVLVLG